jgi:thioesterase domain-containing protein/aryl carrier-like protein
LTTDAHWVVDEHRTTGGVAVLPGTGHLELFGAAAEMSGNGSAVIERVALLEPLVVPDGRPVAVRLSIQPTDEAGARRATIESDGGHGDWRLHSEANLVPGAPRELNGVDVVLDRPEGTPALDLLAGPASRMQLGPRWRASHEAWRDDDVVLGRLSLAEPFGAEIDDWWAHPALVDVATAFGIALGDNPDALYVPVGYERVTRRAPVEAQVGVRSRATTTSEGLLRVDILVTSGEESELLRIEGLSLLPVTTSLHIEVPEPTGHATDRPRRLSLLDLADELGIVAEEGTELIDRLILSGRPRLIASSLELDDLASLLTPQRLDVRVSHASSPDVTSEHGSIGDPVSVAIRGMWADLLGVSAATDDDDFFEMGGHSLIAIRLLSRIHKELGVRIQLAELFESPTISTLTARVLSERPDLADRSVSAEPNAGVAPVGTGSKSKSESKSLVPITLEGDKPPIFVVHGAGGNVLFLWSLARALSGSRPVYGFQARGVDGEAMPDATIEDMAARYVEELRAARMGPYIVGGYSGGGLVAYEMVRQLKSMGEEVDYLVLFDSPLPGQATPSRMNQNLNLARNLVRRGFGPMRPYLRMRMRNSLLRFIPQREGRAEELAQAARAIGAVDVEDSGFVNLFHYFSAAADRYQVVDVEVEAALIKADRVWPVHPHDYGWGQYINGHLDVVEAPGDHWAMFYPENAPRLAAALRQLLDRRERRTATD